jgi:hypothetical protein
MNRDTERLTKAVFVARSRIQPLVESASSAFRIKDIDSELRAYRTLRINPPSTWTVAPVIYDAASDNRKAPTRPNSSSSP